MKDNKCMGIRSSNKKKYKLIYVRNNNDIQNQYDKYHKKKLDISQKIAFIFRTSFD